jgi:hypothetical protein
MRSAGIAVGDPAGAVPNVRFIGKSSSWDLNGPFAPEIQSGGRFPAGVIFKHRIFNRI